MSPRNTKWRLYPGVSLSCWSGDRHTAPCQVSNADTLGTKTCVSIYCTQFTCKIWTSHFLMLGSNRDSSNFTWKPLTAEQEDGFRMSGRKGRWNGGRGGGREASWLTFGEYINRRPIAAKPRPSLELPSGPCHKHSYNLFPEEVREGHVRGSRDVVWLMR